MKRLLLVFVFLASCLGAAQIDNTYDPGAARAADTYGKAEIDALHMGAFQEPYYTQEEASDISGFEALSLMATSTQTSEVLAPLNLTYTLADKHLTPAGYPNLATRNRGIYTIVGFYSKTGSGQAVIVYEWWTRTTAGVETFLATSTETILDGTLTKQQINPFISINTDVTGVPVSNRDILKIYVKRIGTAALTRWYGDGTSGHFNIQVPSNVIMRTDGSNASSSALFNLGGAPLLHLHSGANINSGTVADARIDPDIARDSEVTASISTHAAVTATHGATGAVMGTTNTQTVTNKTMSTGCTWGGTAVPVNKGGTGATTAASALTALGGASLNGSSTVNFAAATTYTGYLEYPSMTFAMTESALMVRQVGLTDDQAVSLGAVLGVSAPNGSVRVTCIGAQANAGGEVLVTGVNNTAIVITDYGNIEATDTDVNVCVYPAGGGGYILKNRIGAVATYTVVYQGKK